MLYACHDTSMVRERYEKDITVFLPLALTYVSYYGIFFQERKYRKNSVQQFGAS